MHNKKATSDYKANKGKKNHIISNSVKFVTLENTEKLRFKRNSKQRKKERKMVTAQSN